MAMNFNRDKQGNKILESVFLYFNKYKQLVPKRSNGYFQYHDTL